MPSATPVKRSGYRPAIGILIDQDQIAMSVTAASPRGRVEIARQTEPCDAETTEAVLGRMLEPWTGARGKRKTKSRPWIRVGLPEARVFQATLPVTAANRQHTPQNFFLEAVQATNVRAEDRIVELINLEIDKRPLVCVAASPRGVIESTVDMLGRLGTRIGLIEPAPTSLFRAGAFHHKPPRSSKICIRFFLGKVQAIGVLAAGAQPLFWHTFDLPQGGETAAVLAAYSTIWMMARHARLTLPIDTVIIHGRPELALSSQQQEAFRTQTATRLFRCDLPGYESSAVAFGLALANPLTDEPGLDLARTVKPPLTIRDIFPYAEVIAHAAMLGAVSLYLVGAAAESNHQLASVMGTLKAFPWITNQDPAKLTAEKKSIEERLKAISSFRDTRVRWAGSLRKIAAAMPHNNLITSLAGDAEIEVASRSGPARAKKKLVVTFETPLGENGALPHEVDGFLASLRTDTTLKRHFPLIELTGIRANPTRQGTLPSASYSIVCLPGADKPKIVAGR